MTADSSAVIAALAAWHDEHERSAAAIADVNALPAHVLLECYSVLTRLPGGLAVPARDAAAVLQQRFPRGPLSLPGRRRIALTEELAAAGVYGGSAYDGLVALEAAAHGEELISRDQRAAATYARLGAPYRLLAT